MQVSGPAGEEQQREVSCGVRSGNQYEPGQGDPAGNALALQRRTGISLHELLDAYNPVIRGWVSYDGAFDKAAPNPTLLNLDRQPRAVGATTGLFNVRSAIPVQVRQFLIRDRRLPNYRCSATDNLVQVGRKLHFDGCVIVTSSDSRSTATVQSEL